MSYARAKQHYEETHTEFASKVVRTDYSCVANGCPNVGCMEDAGEGPQRGTCYHHWREPDRRLWDSITQCIHANFDVMRNHGEMSPELWAIHRAQAQERAAKWQRGES